MSPRERFAANLAKARKRSGMTQQELADRCYVHRTEISLLERGSREPRLGTLMKLVGVLGVTTEVLCAGIAWDEQAQRFKYEGE
jgi:transcriptional regulator with XRE-family HTH domain